MALTRKNPISIEVLAVSRSIEDEELEKQIKELVLAIRSVDHDLLGWLKKQAELVRIRLGHRKGRNIPWQNASYIHVPLLNVLIRR